MARSFVFTPTAPLPTAKTARFGAGNTPGDNWDQNELGKAVKLVAESRMDLCAAGNDIEGFVHSVELATQNGFTIGGFIDQGRVWVTADGLQGTPGTGVIALGDYVVAGSATAKGTALASYTKVCKATTQGAAQAYCWRVVSLGTAGTGAVGTTILIERI